MGTTNIPTGSAGGGGEALAPGAYASAPATPDFDGQTYVSTDGPVTKVGSGGAWLDSIPGLVPAQEPIPTTGWTLGGVAGAKDDTKGVLSLISSPGAAQWGYIRSAQTTDFRVTVWLSCGTSEFDTPGVSMLFGFQQSSGANPSLALHFNAVDGGASGHSLWTYVVNRPNGWLSNVGQTLPKANDPGMWWGPRIAMRMSYDSARVVGGEILIEASINGVHWAVIGTYASGTYGVPDQFFVGLGAPTTGASHMTVWGLKEEAL